MIWRVTAYRLTALIGYLQTEMNPVTDKISQPGEGDQGWTRSMSV